VGIQLLRRLQHSGASSLRLRARVHPAALVHVATLIGGGALLRAFTTKQWFFNDEWEFLVDRGFAGRPLQLLVPHNEHWSTLPLLVYRTLFGIVGVRTYTPYIVVLLLLHLVLAHALWRLMRHSGVDPWIATALAGLFILIGSGFENLTWAFQIGFVGSVLFGVLALLSTDVRPHGRRRLVMEWAFCVAALMCSGIGVSMVVMVGLGALLRRGVRAGVSVVIVPAVVYGAWFVTVGRVGYVGVGLKPSDAALLVPYIWHGLTATFDALTDVMGAGVVVIIGLALWLAVRRRNAIRHPAMTAAALTAPIFFLIDGVGRIALGVDQAGAPRYIYIAAVLLLPLAGNVMSHLAGGRVLFRALVVLVVAAATLHQALVLQAEGQALATIRSSEQRQVIAAAQLLHSGMQTIATVPDPQWATALTVSDLEALDAHDDLPAPIGLMPVDFLNARLALQTSLTTDPVFSGGASPAVASAAPALHADASGCVPPIAGGAPHVTLAFSQPASIRIAPAIGGMIALRLQLAGQPGVSDPITQPLAAAHVLWLNVAQAGETLILALPSATALCGVATR